MTVLKLLSKLLGRHFSYDKARCFLNEIDGEFNREILGAGAN